MKHCAAPHIPVVLALLLGLGNATAQDIGQPEQFYGVPRGWSLDADGAMASTFISSVDATGFVLFHCNERSLDFQISLSVTEADEPAIAQEMAQEMTHDGQLQVYPALAQSDDPMLAHFTVRFRGPDTFQFRRFRHPAEDRAARLLQLIRDYPTGLRLHAIQLRPDRLTPPRRIDLYLPGIANEDGVPMEIALAVVEEACRRPR